MAMLRGAARLVAGTVLGLLLATTALGADAVPTVDVSGTVVWQGEPVEIVSAELTERETPDSDPVTSTFTVAEDGTFTVSLRAWGTLEQPAEARIKVSGPSGSKVSEDGCATSWATDGTAVLSIPGEVPTDPIAITMVEWSIGACTSTPKPTVEPPAALTLPPTDSRLSAAGPPASSALGAWIVVGIWLLALGLLVRWRRPTA
jgi:hypothetical protein